VPGEKVLTYGLSFRARAATTPAGTSIDASAEVDLDGSGVKPMASVGTASASVFVVGMTSGSLPAAGGFGIVVFGGGSFDELIAAAGCATGNVAFWATDSTGNFIVFVPGTTNTAVNASFNARFPNRAIPPTTPLVGRCIVG
jgi:hypothetical protein